MPKNLGLGCTLDAEAQVRGGRTIPSIDELLETASQTCPASVDHAVPRGLSEGLRTSQHSTMVADGSVDVMAPQQEQQRQQDPESFWDLITKKNSSNKLSKLLTAWVQESMKPPCDRQGMIEHSESATKPSVEQGRALLQRDPQGVARFPAAHELRFGLHVTRIASYQANDLFNRTFEKIHKVPNLFRKK